MTRSLDSRIDALEKQGGNAQIIFVWEGNKAAISDAQARCGPAAG
jgi:hypothetical protein